MAVGRIKFDAVIPALFAGSIADLVCQAWGAPHTHYRSDYLEQVVKWQEHIGFNLLLSVKILVAAAAFGLAGYLFGKLFYGGVDVTLTF